MPDQPKTQHRSVRIPDDRWAAAALAAARAGMDRAKVVNELLAWYVREPGAKLPKRPDED
ncbi:MAG TPA: hypothetical protein VEO01_19530 [Pseudonocardiaceae bacterium]|nr:hypothetical protein [Pseudonocardiaceae bacterium]